MDWQHAAVLVIGYLGQHLKAIKNVPTTYAQAILLVVGVGLYALQTPPAGPLTAWLMQAVMWGLTVIGAASTAAAVGIAPKTDSR